MEVPKYKPNSHQNSHQEKPTYAGGKPWFFFVRALQDEDAFPA